jgi:hypothetical protein
LAAGDYHSLGLRSDGEIMAWGQNTYGQCNVPPAVPGVPYVSCDAGESHSVAMRQDGSTVAWGASTGFQGALPELPSGAVFGDLQTTLYSMLAVRSDGWYSTMGAVPLGAPALPPGLRYVRCALGWGHAALLRSDGQLFAWGDNSAGQCNVPPLPPGVRYVDVDTYFGFTVAVRSDGVAVSMGLLAPVMPSPPPGVGYTRVSVHEVSTGLLRTDGQIVVRNTIDPRQNAVPPLPAGLRYTSFSLSKYHGVAIRSDGSAVNWGDGSPVYGIPPLPPGVSYVEVDGGMNHFLLRRSDGQVMATGYALGIWVSPLDPGTSYVGIDAGDGRSIALVASECSYVTFAPGCAGSRPAARLIPRDTPVLGRTIEIGLLDLPSDLAFVVFGWSRTLAGATPLPIALDPLGMPGCQARVSLDQVLFVAGSGGEAAFRIPVPFQPALLGVRFYNQAFVPDAGANALGAVVSDAAAAVVGG